MFYMSSRHSFSVPGFQNMTGVAADAELESPFFFPDFLFNRVASQAPRYFLMLESNKVFARLGEPVRELMSLLTNALSSV